MLFRSIVKKAKEYDRDTIPGDYATLAVACPNCGGVIKENYRRYTCVGALETLASLGRGQGRDGAFEAHAPSRSSGSGRQAAARTAA